MIKKAKSTLATILYLFHLLPDELEVVVGKCDLYLFIQKILNSAKATEAINKFVETIRVNSLEHYKKIGMTHLVENPEVVKVNKGRRFDKIVRGTSVCPVNLFSKFH